MPLHLSGDTARYLVKVIQESRCTNSESEFVCRDKVDAVFAVKTIFQMCMHHNVGLMCVDRIQVRSFWNGGKTINMSVGAWPSDPR